MLCKAELLGFEVLRPSQAVKLCEVSSWALESRAVVALWANVPELNWLYGYMVFSEQLST